MLTRLRNAPEWTAEELYALVSNVAAVEEEWGWNLSSHQKWEMVSSNLSPRSALQCRRKWDSLIAHYTSIASSPADYWSLDPRSRERLGLPPSFHPHLHSLIRDVLQAASRATASLPTDRYPHLPRRRRHGTDSQGEEDEDLDHPEDDDIITSTVCEKARLCEDTIGKVRQHEDTTEKIIEITTLLEEGIEQIEAIHRGELSEDAEGCDSLFVSPKLDVNTNFTRRQADQLIRSYGSLNGYIRRLHELLERHTRS